jgi:hypothetical protein
MVSKSGEILTVESEDQIPNFESILKNGKLSIVLANEDWCSHCVKFKKDIWKPMCAKPAVHNRIAIKSSLIPKTSISEANYKYLPSVLVINEKGKPEEFQTPDGEPTNAMPTPKNIQDMTRVVNVPLKPMSSEQIQTIDSEKEKETNPMIGGGSLYATLTQFSRGIGLRKLYKKSLRRKSSKKRKTSKRKH